MKLGALKTRKFPLWLQAFNLLCAVAAVSILVVGIWQLWGRGRPPALEGLLIGHGEHASVDTSVLAQRIATADGGTAVGQALGQATDREALEVLDAAIASCLPGGLTLGAELAGRSGPAGERASSEIANAIGIEVPRDAEDLRSRVQFFVSKVEARDVSLLLAARAIVQETPLRRRAAVERIGALGDGRGIPALLAALGTPEPERETRALAESVLLQFAGDDRPAAGDGTAEERWARWWSEHRSAWLKPPYDLAQNARLLERRLRAKDEATERDAIRALGIMKVREALPELDRLALAADEASTRAAAAWALGRSGAPEALEPLTRALKDHEPAVRIAAARAIGRARLFPSKPDVEKLLDDKDAAVRRGAALALLGFFDRRGLAEIDVVAFDPQRRPLERIEALEELEEAGDGAAASSRWIAALSDPDEGVRKAARDALARRVDTTEVLVGRPMWQRWWVDRYGGTGVTIPLGAGN